MAAVYTTPSPSNACDRESLVYVEAQRALRSLAGSDCAAVLGPDATTASPLPGLRLAASQTPVVALGLRAHIALASVSKRTLIAGDLRLEEACDDNEDRIEQLVWSSVNTARMIAIGEPAWQSIQLLPAADRCFYDAPPLPLRPADLKHPSILVIDHEATGRCAFALVETLDAARLSVERIAVAPRDPAFLQPNPWNDTALIHVHVGEHTSKTEQPRLIDSWHGGRLTIHLLGRRSTLRQDPSVPALTIDDQKNGFLCSTPNEVVDACRDLLDDPVLRHEIVAAARGSVAPFLEVWRSIANDLLS